MQFALKVIPKATLLVTHRSKINHFRSLKAHSISLFHSNSLKPSNLPSSFHKFHSTFINKSPNIHHTKSEVSYSAPSSNPTPSNSFSLDSNTNSKRLFSNTSSNSSTENNVKLNINDSADYFYSSKSVTWESLGIDNRVINAIKQTGFLRPSSVQERAIPSILTGKDVILAAETGSGKTLSYLIPLFHILISNKSKEESNQIKVNRNKKFAIVLCPNSMLCKQVEAMAQSLKDEEDGTSLLSVSSVSRGDSWPNSSPDLIISTPASLLNYIISFENNKKRMNFLKNAMHLVVDEADMLLTGGFERSIKRIIDFLKFEEKSASSFLNIDQSQSQSPYENEDFTTFSSFSPQNSESEDDEGEGEGEGQEEEGEGEGKNVDYFPTRWQKQKEYVRSKQYVFVAATLPENGKKSVGEILKKNFPDAIRVNGKFLHMQNPKLQQLWIQTTEQNQNDELHKIITNLSSQFPKLTNMSQSNSETPSSNTYENVQRILIFANTTRSVDSIGKYLAMQDVDCAIFHRDVELTDRMHALDYFKVKGGVLICTDSAARGMDVMHVHHVIQAEFATCAVDYLHRVGRTARAGKDGVVTNFFTTSNKPLVDAVKNAIQNNLPVESAFSRGRSFSKKFKKYGPTRRGVPGKGRANLS